MRVHRNRKTEKSCHRCDVFDMQFSVRFKPYHQPLDIFDGPQIYKYFPSQIYLIFLITLTRKYFSNAFTSCVLRISNAIELSSSFNQIDHHSIFILYVYNIVRKRKEKYKFRFKNNS